MKILIPHSTNPGSSGDLAVSSKSLAFSEVSQGHHVGLIPIRMKGANTTFERLYRVEISGEASDNGKGYRRVMLKATIPYHRVWTADPAAAENMREKQESTSAGSISMHVVLSIPSKVRQDLIESSDAAATFGAEGHLAVVGALVSALTDQIRKPALVQTADAGVLVSDNPPTFTVDDEGNATITGQNAVIRLAASSQSLTNVNAYESERFGTSGLDVDATGSRACLSQTPRDPLVRGLFGLVPVEENTSVVAGPGIIKFFT